MKPSQHLYGLNFALMYLSLAVKVCPLETYQDLHRPKAARDRQEGEYAAMKRNIQKEKDEKRNRFIILYEIKISQGKTRGYQPLRRQHEVGQILVQLGQEMAI